jgi:putative transposase
MRLIDEQFLETPWYGSRQMARHLRREGHGVGRKRARRPMAKMELEPIYQRPCTAVPHPGHQIHPYLLREMVIDRPNPLWCADITYIPARRGFLYLVAVMDWSTRKVLSWFVVTSLDRPASGELAASLSAGHRRCLYRAIDEAGVTADFLLIANQDREAALRFLRKAI